MDHNYTTSELDYDDSASESIYHRSFSSPFLSSSVLLQIFLCLSAEPKGLVTKL